MGKITDELLALIAKQVEDHGLVVRYDPARHYADIAETLGLPRTTVLHFTGSFFELRARLEPFVEFVGEDGEWLRDERTERAVVYVPLDRGSTRHALVEAEQAGKVIEPGADHWQRNSRLKVIAERVLRGAAPGRAATIAAEIEAGRWSLAELDRLADQTGELGALQLLFDSTAATDLVPGFLSSEERDEAIVSKQALREIVLVVEETAWASNRTTKTKPDG